jgi:ABC-type uncharacterized transport system involved in gliding motility auxiliary subunit
MLMLFIVVMVNMIIVGYDVKKDFTKNKVHTLSEQSIKVLKDLKTEVKITAFIYPTQLQDFEKIFDKYGYYSKFLKKDYIDLDKDPLAVQRFSIKQPGTLIVESENRTVKIDNLNGEGDPRLEERLTNAIIQVTKGGKKKLYYLTGHGEKLLTDNSKAGFSDVKDNLENGRYQVEELVLLKKGEIPADAELVMSTGPTTEFMESELKILENYLKQRAGKFLLLLEPNSPQSLQGFLAKFGVDWKKNKAIFETNRIESTRNPLTPLIETYSPTSEITQNLKQYSLFSVATPVERAAKIPDGYKIISLFTSSPSSYEIDLVGDKFNLGQKPGKKGPLSLAVSVTGASTKKESKDPKEAKDNDFRMVVIGDSDFASNGLKRFSVNSDLFQNTLSWLSKEEDLIAIRPKEKEGGQFDITDYRAQVIFLTSVIFAPITMFITGIVVWFRRRKL